LETGGRPLQGSLFSPEQNEQQAAHATTGELVGRQDLYARGMRTLQIMHAINLLEDGKVRRGEVWRPYDLQLLQLHAVRLVVDHMDLLQGGIGRLALTRALADVADKMAPGADPGMATDVAQVVIDWLLNSDDNEDVYRPTYMVLDAQGQPHALRATISILRERQDMDGNLVIRASVEAVNLLLGALSDDVADGQRAEERLLADNIDSGRFDAAVDSARRARLRSIQYAEHLARYLVSAQQDIGALDWAGSIREELDDALTHIQDRLRAEGSMWDRAEEKRIELEGSERVETVLRVQAAIKDCLDRHTRLHGLLLDAGPTFRLEQEQQRFLRTPSPFRLSLRKELTDLLRRSVAKAGNPMDVFFRSVVGPVPPPVLTLDRLISELGAPAREIMRSPPEIPEPELVPEQRRERFPPQTVDLARSVFSACGAQPRRLSALLAGARELDKRHPTLAAEYVRLLAMDAFDAPSRDDGETDYVSSMSDGQTLKDPEYGGDDLLISAAASQAARLEESQLQ